MPDEKDKIVQDDHSEDYNNALTEALKSNEDLKKQLDIAAKEKKELLEQVVNGQPGDKDQDDDNTLKYTDEDIKSLRNALYTHEVELSNIDYCQKTLDLRDALIERGEIDPFLPIGHNLNPTEEDIRKASNVAQVMRECIEYAQGDSEAFTNELMRRTNDVKIPNVRRS